MTKAEIQKLSRNEIFKLSLEKNGKGVATSDALTAQRIIHEESGAFNRGIPIVNLCKRDRSYYSDMFY